MNGGGSTSTNEFKPPSYTQEPWKNYISGAQNLANNGLQQYQGQTVANISPMQMQGLQMQTDYTMQGTPERAAAGQTLTGAMQGQMNPYAAMINPFAGNNPYLSSMIDTSNAKIADQYRRGTANQTDSMFARSGAFGGSAWRDATGQNELNLAGALGANTNNLLGQNYNQSSQLAESGLNRATQGWQSGMGNALNAANISQGQQGLDQSAISNLLQAGNIPTQYQQSLLNAGKDYFQQGQQNQFTLQDFLGNALTRASGGQGTQTYTSPGQSPISGLLGAGALGYGLLG